ncbi:NUDIX hydrolase [Candidatus Uhrbacteria bacterium]|nr:NUDIX hydrolase [Candidatus Uhrbacteria bacterium]
MLEKIFWSEGRRVELISGPYRHRIILVCSSGGRQQAIFKNGPNRYFCYLELVDSEGKWTEEGTAIVPVLPDGRLVMIVEQRPPEGRYSDRPMVARIGGKDVDLGIFGKDSSLEFPGGAIEPGEGVRSGFLRELVEETGVEESQKSTLYLCTRPVYPFGSDISIRNRIGVIFLSGLYLPDRVDNDGGLRVFSLSEEEVEENIMNGIVHSGQAGIIPFAFFEKVRRLMVDSSYREKITNRGYISIEKVTVKK